MPTDIPDLELPAADKPDGGETARSPASGLRRGGAVELEDDGALPALALESRPPPPRVSPQGGGGGFDLDDDDGDGPGESPLRLAGETSRPPAPLPKPGAAGHGSPGLGLAGPGLSGVASPPSSRGRSPLALPPTDAELAQASQRAASDEIEMRAIARFGPPPAAWWGAPGYAVRVLLRRREIQAGLAPLRKQLEDAEAAEGEAFVQMVDRARRAAGPGHAFAEMTAALARFDQMAAESDDALAAANQTLHQQIEAIDRELQLLEDEVKRLDRDIEAAQEDVARADEQRVRSEAKVKRAEIELRAAHEAARNAAGPQAKFAPPEHAKRIRDLTAEKQARDAEHAPVRDAWESANRVVRELSDAQRAIRRKMSPLLEQRRSAKQSGMAQVALRAEGSEAALRERRRAYREIGALMLESRAHEIDEADRAAVARSGQLVQGQTRTLELHLRALSAADPDALRKGQMLLGAAVVALVALVILLAAL